MSDLVATAAPDPPVGVDERLPRWLVVRDRGGAAALRWQLIARNGRVLGRSTVDFADETEARADFAVVSGLAAELTVTVEHASPGPGWRWRVDDAAGRTLLRSPRSFERYGSCQRSGKRILESLAMMSAAPR